MQNLLKSIFISGYTLVAMISLFYGGYHFIMSSNFSYLGLAICGGVMTVFLSVLFLTTTARTKAYMTPYSIVMAVGLILSVYFYLQNNDFTLLLLTFLNVLGWILYLTWYSVFKDREDNIALKKGNQLPTFELEDSEGNVIKSSNFTNAKSIILFFRGNWCPLCMAQIKEIAGLYKELEKRGVQTIFVSPQPHKFSRSLARKYDLGFQFLVDKGNKVAKQLNLYSKSGTPMGMQVFGYENDTVMPTIILTDDRGKIVYSDLTSNYRIRPEPQDFIEVFDNLK